VRDRDPVVTRLRDLRARALRHGPIRSPSARTFVIESLAALGGFLPTGESTESLRSGLERAGIRAQRAELVFLGSKIVLAVVLSLGWVSVNLRAGPSDRLHRPSGRHRGGGGLLPPHDLALSQGRNA